MFWIFLNYVVYSKCTFFVNVNIALNLNYYEEN